MRAHQRSVKSSVKPLRPSLGLLLTCIVLSVLAVFLVWSTRSTATPSLPSLGVSSHDLWRCYKFLLRKQMERDDHIFFPASHPHLHFAGRWMPTANGLRRDAAFPGSYVEMTITNTTAVSLSLNNVHMSQQQKASEEPLIEERDKRTHVTLKPVHHRLDRPSNPVSVMVHIDGDSVYGAEEATAISLIADDLDPHRKYKIRITHMGGRRGGTTSADDGAVFEFEGVWLKKLPPPVMGPVSGTPNQNRSSDQEMRPALLEPTSDHASEHRRGENETAAHHPASLQLNPIEILTSETPPPDSFFFEEKEDIGQGAWLRDMAETKTAALWYSRLGARFSVDMVAIPTYDLGLLSTSFGSKSSVTTVQDLFFRSGPPGTVHFSRPWSSRTYYSPSVLLLQLGLADFVRFYPGGGSNNKHDTDQFVNAFVTAYVKFIRTVRRTAYPSEARSSTGSEVLEGSYIYNSAPSTLPIFLITPFSASGRFVAANKKLDKVISAALQQVVHVSQADGDKSTFWIDTTGWLDHKTDFWRVAGNDTSSPDRLFLTPSADDKVARLLADHLCPYLGNPDLGGEDCPFDRYDNYLGNVYLPQDVEFDTAVLERKIATIKERFQVQGSSGGF